ncbi:hypothetical protein H9P43_002751 [Blastocladiella emersonii ATCC 22665]|nr:hypothetical protein H9P43_002751 [Blastocladiella emersonii ATCC 22665]
MSHANDTLIPSFPPPELIVDSNGHMYAVIPITDPSAVHFSHFLHVPEPADMDAAGLLLPPTSPYPMDTPVQNVHLQLAPALTCDLDAGHALLLEQEQQQRQLLNQRPPKKRAGNRSRRSGHDVLGPAAASWPVDPLADPASAVATPGAPRRPPNSFFLYMKDRQEALKHTLPKRRELTKVISEQWRQESDEVRAHYQQRAKEVAQQRRDSAVMVPPQE